MADLGYDAQLDGPADKVGKGRKARKTADNLAAIAEYDGNLAERLDENARKKMGEEVVREYEHDEKSREEWLQGVDRAIKNARQKPEKKNYPFENASNIKYPLLTTAMNQFGARAYGAITRSDQPMVCKVIGEDRDGRKAKRADRLARFGNYQLMYIMDEWDAGTDKLLHMLPVMGAGFRKGYWRGDMARPTLEYTSARDVVVPNDAPSFDRAPRMTQPTPMYPYEIDRLVQSKQWLEHKCDHLDSTNPEDSQKSSIYLEQVRYFDLDGDGMMEPYIATVSKDHSELVRLEAAFYANSIRVNSTDGKVETIMRESPWIDYSFLPDIEGSVYGMGFGQLLESLGSAINTALNQIFDAAHRQNAGGGFISQGLRLRGGEVRVRPSEFINVNVPGRVSDAIHELQLNGPSPVLFQLIEFLLGAAQDITSVKDVMTGEAPSGQAMGATLALIEQGMQVFSTIYTRIYRAMRKEFRLLMRLNARYLDPSVYAEFLDDEEFFAELMGLPPPGSMPQTPMGGGMPPGMPLQPPQIPTNIPGMPGMDGMSAPAQPMPPMPAMPPQGMAPTPSGLMMPKPQKLQLSPQGLEELAKDFDLRNMDCAPGADPRSVTDMQRMMRAQYLAQFKGQPGINNREIQERELEAANSADRHKLFLDGPSPMDELAAEEAKQNVRNLKLDGDLKEQQTKKTAKEAEKVYHEAGKVAFERGVMESGGSLEGEGGKAQEKVDPREQELADREMGVKMREMETRELEAAYNYDIAKKKLDVDADTSNRELAIKEQDSAAVRQREDKFDETLNVVLQAVGAMAQGVDAVVKGQQQVTAIMLAPRVLVKDADGKPIAAKPDFSGGA